MNRLVSFLSITLLLTFSEATQAQAYEMSNGKIHFTSDAPLENIQATSVKLRGLMDLSKNSFAFTVEIETFQGFNSPLQREHFNENYMESDDYPKSTFSGKFIDKFDPTATKQTIRAKGFLEIHGITKERIIQAEITKSGSSYMIKSEFNVLLVDHGIKIPRIVHQKISEIINVEISGEMTVK